MNVVTEYEDTIAAIATPPGTGGIAVIRISGTSAIEKSDIVFHGKKQLIDARSHTVHFGKMMSAEGGTIDEVLATVFHAPHSYTGENTVEFSCHGGMMVTKNILYRVLETNVRHALPGEFTKRAFLNGRMDLTQAEAVADLIHAQTEDARAASLHQLEGTLSSYVRKIRDQLLHTASLLELSLDFAEEDVDFAPREDMRRQIAEALSSVRRALATYSSGRVLRDGIKVSFVGKPNTGKSSLLNAILGTRRAIVTDIPGTTRDFIEESMNIKGALIRFVDTAGLREPVDLIEREGMELSIGHLKSSDIVCDVIDSSSEKIDEQFFHQEVNWLRTHGIDPSRMLFILNKCDLVEDKIEWMRIVCAQNGTRYFFTSALHGTGIQDLTDWLSTHTHDLSKKSIETDIIVTNARHASCLRRAEESLERALDVLNQQMTEEFIAVDVRRAGAALAEIIGIITTEDVLNNIFSRFCIGK